MIGIICSGIIINFQNVHELVTVPSMTLDGTRRQNFFFKNYGLLLLINIVTVVENRFVMFNSGLMSGQLYMVIICMLKKTDQWLPNMFPGPCKCVQLGSKWPLTADFWICWSLVLVYCLPFLYSFWFTVLFRGVQL